MSALLFGFSFAVVVQLAANQEAARTHTWTRRLYFLALLLFINATGSALILIVRAQSILLNYVLPVATPGDTDQTVLAVLDAPWVSLVLTSLVLSLIIGVILWMASMVTLAFRDSRSFTLFVFVSVTIILILFFIGLTQMG